VKNLAVISAQAEIHVRCLAATAGIKIRRWIPACAGMTNPRLRPIRQNHDFCEQPERKDFFHEANLRSQSGAGFGGGLCGAGLRVRAHGR
jgi:hypothetical protein